MIELIVTIVVALALLGTVIWAADKYLQIPGPFAWAKGVVMFILIVVACYFVWDYFVAHHAMLGHLR
jgi:hypothetical protein